MEMGDLDLINDKSNGKQKCVHQPQPKRMRNEKSKSEAKPSHSGVVFAIIFVPKQRKSNLLTHNESFVGYFYFLFAFRL